VSGTLLTVENLHVAYRRGEGWSGRGASWFEAVRGVSLSLEAGSIHGLAGESGSGKSTVARALVQLVPPRQGSVRLGGTELIGASRERLRDARRRIQLVFQDPGAALSPRRTVAQTLEEPARHFGLDAGRERLVDVLEAVGLDATALDRLPNQFSSGQRQRIAIARALICEPDLLIADEALSALDVSVQARILGRLRRLRDERGLTILLISHDLAVLRENANHVTVMYRGRCVEQAPTNQLFSAPAHPYTQQLIGALPGLDPACRPQTPPPGVALATEAVDGGCAFRSRCSAAFSPCAEQAPEPVAVPGNMRHHVECHLMTKRSPGD
jgi:oligopeptide/dipeptide ABC transporter ATP-binding protein